MRTRAFVFLLSSLIVTIPGCLDRPIDPVEPAVTTTFTQSLPSEVTKIDLLLAIDNSSSMADKQAILASAVPSLVGEILNPSCVDVNGKAVAAKDQPQDPLADCPRNTSREFPPVTDVHVGIVSSSLGGLGICDPNLSGNTPQMNDRGRLVARTLPGTPAVPTHDDHDFLAWSPKDKGAPAGENVLTDFETDLRALVAGVGEQGCGYEAQLESWFRFLVEPAPNDDVLTGERADFLRPDSLVTIVVLTDENDCSVVPDGYAGALFDTNDPLPRPTSICATNPDDHCCAPCGYEPSDCKADPACSTPADMDPINLRCFDQKRRFGHDFLYPTQRYIDALTQDTVVGLDGKTYPNPLFPGIKAGAHGRSKDAGLVYLAGIVGVPWQDIARKNAKGEPDLLHGLDADGAAVGGFLSSTEMSQASGKWGTTWDLILGDTTKGTQPADALMHESIDPRSGENPVVGARTAPTSASSPDANPVNGHEWTTTANPEGDLQYACIFPLKKPISCNSNGGNCDCFTLNDEGAKIQFDTPVCQDADGSYNDVQRHAHAYPGLRQLEVLQGLGDQGIVASICPAELDPSKPDYGYKPAVGAIVEKLKQRIAATCLPLTLTPQKGGDYPCIVLEGHETEKGCDCKSAGRKMVTDEGALRAEDDANQQHGSKYACFCEIEQLAGADREACEDEAGDPDRSVNGWCYVDPLAGVGKPEVVQNCPSGQKRQLRLVNGGNPEGDTTTYITCTD